MKIVRTEILVDTAGFSETEIWKTLHKQIVEGIHQCRWPLDAEPGSFTLFDGRHANGVKPIKVDCMKYLENHGWDIETPSRVATALKPGPIDAAYPVGNKLFSFEWETGNVSSSHRALGKLAVGLIQGDFIGGVLVVPSRTMYYYLTDRIGNIREIEPYYPIYKAIKVEEGTLAIIVIEHDALSNNKEDAIPKGMDGNSLARRRLLEEGLPLEDDLQERKRTLWD